MKEFNELPFSKRPDLTPYLVHLTKSSDEDSAFDNLVSILKDGKINGSSGAGFIRKPHKAVCFMDVPIPSLKYVITTDNKHRYESYGVLVTKQLAYKNGARPVLYLSPNEMSEIGIKDAESWRVVRFEVKNKKWISWMHEREWRSKGDFLLPKDPLVVFVKSSLEANKLRKLISDEPEEFKSIPRSIVPLNIVCQGLVY